jgi:hypothetical protein
VSFSHSGDHNLRSVGEYFDSFPSFKSNWLVVLIDFAGFSFDFRFQITSVHLAAFLAALSAVSL